MFTDDKEINLDTDNSDSQNKEPYQEESKSQELGNKVLLQATTMLMSSPPIFKIMRSWHSYREVRFFIPSINLSRVLEVLTGAGYSLTQLVWHKS